MQFYIYLASLWVVVYTSKLHVNYFLLAFMWNYLEREKYQTDALPRWAVNNSISNHVLKMLPTYRHTLTMTGHPMLISTSLRLAMHREKHDLNWTRAW